ncbi:TerB family tellurite resistance protein [Dyadobacter sp. MSC1_007]|jgi:hypothetical protein|uniref:TerB family tellurite resistance protein n=1 Tax=Dyadobacter sp. MSC1_007 TaxID=2909264 RepID=UPI002030DDC0|nr:TerB family tellurite resistance protein [Dyadobacter sp. MSC1_007]
MKRILILLLIFSAWAGKAHAQTPEVTQLILNIEKLDELRKILTELKKGYEILQKGYNTIRDISKGNFQLHQAFLDGLLQVSPAVRNYKRIADIAACQLAILTESRQARSALIATGQMSADEQHYLDSVYDELIEGSIRNLDALTQVLTAKRLRASDDERLRAIDAIYEDMSDKLVFLRHFNAGGSLLAAQRREERASTRSVGRILGVDQ